MGQEFEAAHPRGSQGRWVETPRDDPGSLQLSPKASHTGGHAQLLQLPAEQLQQLVDGSQAERVLAAKAAALTDEQAEQLAAPHQPFAVRLMVATRTHPGVAARAAADPDPVVRLRALDLGFDLPDEVRQSLARDPEVRRAATVFGHSSAHVQR